MNIVTLDQGHVTDMALAPKDSLPSVLFFKVERVKELLVYNELKLTEIAYKMHYSSVAHLCTQFKKVTGLTTSSFKSLKGKRRSLLEYV